MIYFQLFLEFFKTGLFAVGGGLATVPFLQEMSIKYGWFTPGKFLFPMGSYQECTDECSLKADSIVVDHIGQTLHRGALGKLGGEGRITEKNIYGTIGEIAAGKKEAPASGQRILCIPIGTGAMDIGVASLAWKRAAEKGIGGKYPFVEY